MEEKFLSGAFEKVGTGQAVAEVVLTAPEGHRINNILSLSASTVITPAEVFSGEARYAAVVTVRAVVRLDNGVTVISGASQFTDRVTGAAIDSGTSPVFSATVADLDKKSLGETEARVSAVVDVTAFACVTSETDVLTNAPDGVYLDSVNLKYGKCFATKTENAYVGDVIDNVKADRVLSINASAVVKEVSAVADAVTVSGCVCGQALFQVGDLIEQRMICTKFDKELVIPGVKADDTVVASLATVNCDCAYDPATQKAEVEYTVETTACVVQIGERDFACGAFSLKNDLDKTCEQLNITLNRSTLGATVAVDFSQELDASAPAADNVLCVIPTDVAVAKAEATDGAITVEGVITADAVYYNADNSTVAVTSIAAPFCERVKAQVNDGDSLTVTATVCDAHAKVRRESVIDFKFDVMLDVNASCSYGANVITKLEPGAVRPEPQGAVAVHIAKKGETLWDVARALYKAPEQILVDNPDVTMPFQGGERLIAFRHEKH